MKKKLFVGLILFVLVLFSGIFINKQLKVKKYRHQISNISTLTLKKYTLKGMTYYDKGTINCIMIFNSNCNLCMDEIEDFVDNIDVFKSVNFYLVSNQTEKELIDYNTDSEFLALNNFTILQDKNQDIYKYFSHPIIPSIFIYNKENELLAYKNGFASIDDIKNIISKN